MDAIRSSLLKPQLEQLGRYVIVDELGQGAMGTVYKAIDPLLDRTVALKTVNLDLVTQDMLDFQKRFEREAKSTGRLNHPNIVIVHDYGEVDHIAYIAMEFLAGKTLRVLLEGGKKLPADEAVRYAVQVADALASAHAQGVIHRDIKPSNIVRLDADGTIKLTDFGIALIPNVDLTQTGTVLGTPKYMSPEQVRGLRVDGRSDIFSLGAVLYEMLTGATAFDGASLTAIMFQVISASPVHPAKHSADVPDALSAILSKCLAKNPQARYQDAAELARDLRGYRNLKFPAGAATSFSTAPVVDNSGAAVSPRPASRLGQDRAAARSRRNERPGKPRGENIAAQGEAAAHASRWRRAAAWVEARPATSGLFALGIAVLVIGVAVLSLRHTPPSAAPAIAPSASTEPPRAVSKPLPPPQADRPAVDGAITASPRSDAQKPEAAAATSTAKNATAPVGDARKEPASAPSTQSEARPEVRPVSERPAAELGVRASRGQPQKRNAQEDRNASGGTATASAAKPSGAAASGTSDAPKKRDDSGKSFWQRQKECLTQNKCDPPSTARDSVN